MIVPENWDKTESTIYDDEGRSVVPKPVRKELDLEPGDKIQFVNAEGIIVVKKKD